MKKYLLLGFSVLLFCVAAQGLVCRVCECKIGDVCLWSEPPCQAAPGQYCEMTRIHAGKLPLCTKYGCGKYAGLCNKTEHRDTPVNMKYERTCCNSDLCTF